MGEGESFGLCGHHMKTRHNKWDSHSHSSKSREAYCFGPPTNHMRSLLFLRWFLKGQSLFTESVFLVATLTARVG